MYIEKMIYDVTPIPMTDLEKAQLLYEMFDFLSDYDYSDCQNFNEFVSKVFSLAMRNLDEKERKG